LINEKTFEHSGDRANRIGVVGISSSKLTRVSIVLLVLLAWFSISNHCALALLTPAETVVAMHSHCHQTQPGPEKKSSDEQLPCCKVLRATLSNAAKAIQDADKIWLPFHDWKGENLILISHLPHRGGADELDTGPPFARSFAELTLQRSILAHAPPFFA
jgi:hypothetical protein